MKTRLDRTCLRRNHGNRSQGSVTHQRKGVVMNFRMAVVTMVVGLVMAVFGIPGVNAQTKDVSVSFLRAAASSLSDRANVSFDAIYVAKQGMVEPQTWNMKGRGLSRFSVEDPQSHVIFENMYCSQDSRAFKDLVNLDTNKMVHFAGYKDSGENNQASIYVTSVEILAMPVPAASEGGAANTKSLRVTIKDKMTNTKTVLVNVVPGKTYTSDNLSIMVEAETESNESPR